MPSAPARLRDLLSREGAATRAAVAVFFIVAVIYGGGKETPQYLRDLRQKLSGPASPLDAADSDGDRIPDEWERWTGTDPLVADSSLDPDGDGLANLDEYLLRCDPQCADTDNDGIDDATEAAGLARGIPDCDPAVPATFAAEEPDADGDGIPDIWEATGAPLFAGLDADGFPAGFAMPAASPGNYDVLLAVTTSRHALLSWDGPDGSQSVLLPPCDGLALRLRLDAGATRAVALSPAPGASGTWRGGMAATWDSRRDQPTDGNRVAPGNGVFIDREGDDAVAVGSGIIGNPAANLRRGTGGGSARVLSFIPRVWSMSLSVWPGCNEHDFGSMVTLEAENAPPPYVWYCGEDTDGPTTNQLRYVPFDEFRGEQTVLVGVRCDDGVHSNLVMGASIDAYGFRCHASATNFLLVAALPDYDVMANHAPRLEPRTVHNGGNCPDACILDVYAGWTHNEALLHIRNLIRIVTNDPRDDDTSHCIGLVWRAGGSISLYDYLADCCKPFADNFSYYVNGEPCDGTLEFGKVPDEIRPAVFHVELRLLNGGTVLDRMWVVVYSHETAAKYEKWKMENTSLSWTTNLPPVISSIAMSTNGAGITPNNDVAYSRWGKPSASSTYLHHNAVFGMRSENVGEHGHQATYDERGCAITHTVAAGTADFKHPLSLVFPAWTVVREDHYRHDVIPFLRALILDGNPCIYNNRYAPTNLNRPMLYQGDYLDDYLTRRPPTPTGVIDR